MLCAKEHTFDFALLLVIPIHRVPGNKTFELEVLSQPILTYLDVTFRLNANSNDFDLEIEEAYSIVIVGVTFKATASHTRDIINA